MSVDALENFFASADTSIRFTRRPDPVPADLRLAWRISMIVLILHRCRGGSATLRQAHVLGWAVRNTQTRETFLRWVQGKKRPDDIIVRYDPSLSRTIDLSIGAGLVSRKNAGAVVLTAEGTTFARELERQRTILVNEKTFLSGLPRRMTQKYIDELIAPAG